MTACQLAKNKVGVQNQVLYLDKLWFSVLIYLVHYINFDIYILVTREPIPSQILKKWCPIVPLQGLSTSKRDSGIENLSSDASEDSPSSPIAGPFLLPPPSQLHQNRSEDEVAEDIINISDKKLIYPSDLMIN